MLNRRLSARLMRVLGPLATGATMIGGNRALVQTPGASPAATPEAQSVQEAVITFSEFEAAGDIHAIVRSHHPDSLNVAPGYVVAGWYRDEVFPRGPQVAEPTGDVTQVPAWTWPVTGEQYAVTEVPYRQAFDTGDVVEGVAALARAPEIDYSPSPYLRFFGDTQEFVETQVTTWHDRLVANAFVTDFQLLSFPPRAIDLSSALAATWEDFQLAASGTIEGVEAGQWARYVHPGSEGPPEPAEELQVSWIRVADPAAEPRAFDYALRAPVRFGAATGGFEPGLLLEPDVALVTTKADHTFAQVQAPSTPDSAALVTDRLVFMVPDDSSVWYHMVQATFTDPNGGLAQRFASSLPYIAV